MPSLRDVLRFVRIEHSVFALPFVYIGILLAPVDPTPALFALATLAAIGARGTAFGLNRILDRHIDAANPRTAMREVPSGRIPVSQAWMLTGAFLIVYLATCWFLNPLVFLLSPIPVAAFVVYPYTKRFTWLCHLVLGFTLGFSPMGGFLAATGTWTGVEAPLLVAFGVMFWVAGFDIVYAFLDVAFDRAHGVHSVPADFGVRSARIVAVALHLATLACLAAAGWVAGLGWWYGGALVVAAALLLAQHLTVRPDDPASVNRAAFTVNGYTGFVILGGVLLSIVGGG